MGDLKTVLSLLHSHVLTQPPTNTQIHTHTHSLTALTGRPSGTLYDPLAPMLERNQSQNGYAKVGMSG